MGNRHVTDAELAVLEVLWDLPSATIRRITDALYPEAGVSEYATVQKLLERLEVKRCVRRDRSGKAHRFAARVDRGELIGRRLNDLADRLCGGSLGSLLTHLVQPSRLSADDRARLRRLLAKLDADNHGDAAEGEGRSDGRRA